jgi:PLD-like domain
LPAQVRAKRDIELTERKRQMAVKVRAFLSPTLVLLAFDWPEGVHRADFLGFSISRRPGFAGAAESYLPNRLTFAGPRKDGDPEPTSDANPIQTFHWWDSRIDDADRGATFAYTVTPITGTVDAPGNPASDPVAHLVHHHTDAKAIDVTLPPIERDGIGTWFNRAVASSQAFVNEFGHGAIPANRVEAGLAWLADGMEAAIPDFLAPGGPVEGAIYHLTDHHWVIPALATVTGSFAYHANAEKKRDGTTEVVDAPAIAALPNITFAPRTHTTIMHDKFIVRTTADGSADSLLAGSANFTTEGLSVQANVIHTFRGAEAKPLAQLYLARKRFLDGDPQRDASRAAGAWSAPVPLAGGSAKVFFSPEITSHRVCLADAVDRIEQADKSVLFCLFDPTDKELLDALFGTAPRGKVMLGLVNSLKVLEAAVTKDQQAAGEVVATHEGSAVPSGVVGYNRYGGAGSPPHNFWYENSTIPGVDQSIHVHHKFLIVDGETDNPSIYTGSANLSNNSLHNNDENLLRIDGIPWLARIYVAEFMRLYEHYRARQAWENWSSGRPDTYRLYKDAGWARREFTPGTQRFLLRTQFAG